MLVENRTILFNFFLHRKYVCLHTCLSTVKYVTQLLVQNGCVCVCARECVNGYVCWQLADVGSVWKKCVLWYVLRTRMSECATDSRNTITWAASENSPNDLDNKFTSKWHIFHVPTIIRLYSLSPGGNWNFYGQWQPVTERIERWIDPRGITTVQRRKKMSMTMSCLVNKKWPYQYHRRQMNWDFFRFWSRPKVRQKRNRNC